MQKIKKALSRRRNTGKMYEAKDLINEIEKFQYVSFDIFDTLLKRNVLEPADVFRLMECEIGNKYDNFAEKRIVAEKKAREKKKANEVTIDDIYAEFQGLTKEEVMRLINLELETEEAVLVVNQDMFPVYQACLDLKKEIYIISDMYLPKSFLEKVLKRNGILEFNKLYVSCEENKTKQTGELFSLFLQEQNIEKNNVVHIGDSKYSDYEVPLKMGIKAISIPRIINRCLYNVEGFNEDIRLNLLSAFINNSVPKDSDVFYRFGYEKFGMFLWGYIIWLYQETKKEGINRLYFFSRDGLIMKKAFDLYNNDKRVETYYLEVSRRSLRVPILWMDCEFSTILNMVSPSKLISLKSIFDGVGLEIEDYKKLISQYGFDESSSFDRNSILDNASLLSMYEELKPDIIETSKKEYDLLQKYIKQNHVSGKFAIIDIGWSGGMQRYLDQTLTRLNIEHEIYGYYIGVAAYFKRNTQVVNHLNMKGYLFDFKNNENEVDKRNCFVGLFETLFLEQGGSVKNYCVNSDTGEIIATRYPYEYFCDGKPTDEFLKVTKIQTGALDFISNMRENGLIQKFTFTADELFDGLKKTGANPTKKDIELFADFNFYDEGENEKLAAPKSLFYYIIHLKQFKRDFLLCRWKTGFMKRMLKIKLPYEKMYNILRRLSGAAE